jgi:SAM-dependent methyltransferase
MRSCFSCKVKLIDYNDVGVYCPSCFSVYSKEIPSDLELAEYYSNYNLKYHGGGRDTGAETRQIKYAEKYLRYVDRYTIGKSILDVGSANSPFPNFAFKKGYQVSVLDYTKPLFLENQVTFYQSSLENFKFDKLNFDIVTCFAILEHTKDPLKSLKILSRLVAKNGYLLIYIPEAGSFFDRFSLGTTKWLFPPEHLSLLSNKGLNAILNDLNFSLVYQSKFEINFLRYFVRYSIGFIEGLIGFSVKTFFGNDIWSRFRYRRKSFYQGMSISVYKSSR